MTNEPMWAICSGRSGQMSKWAKSSVFLSKSLIFYFALKKWAIRSKKFEKIVFFTFSQFFLKFLKKAKDSLIPSERTWAICSGRSEGMSDRERFAQVAHKKNERMSKSLTFWANRSFAQFFWQKTSDSLQNSMSEFPTLNYSHLDGHSIFAFS